jgi:hypothetical protein
MERLQRAMTGYWFYWLLPLGLVAAWKLALTPDSLANPIMTERVFLFDFAVFLPLVYFLYLRSRVTRRAALVRAFALGGAGISYAAWLMPDGTGEVLPFLAWLRWTALPLLIAIEFAAFVALMRHIYGSEPEEAKLVEQGIPRLVVRLLMIEARFWKRVFRFLTGRH